MADRTFIGGASAIQQVDTATPSGTITVSDSTVLTLTDESGAMQSLTVTASGTTVSSLCTDITAAWADSSLSLFVKVTPTNNSTDVSFKAVTAGTPFYLSITSDDTIAHTTDTPNSGPSDYNCQANWAQNTVPASGDNVLITGSSNIYYGLYQASVSIGAFATDSKYQGQIGGPGTPLSINPTAFSVNGGGTMYFDLNAAAIPVTVTNGSRITVNGTALTTIIATGGNLSMGVDPGDVTTLTTFSLQSSAQANIGSGATLTTFKQASGTATLATAATTVEAQAGTLTLMGSGAITTLTNSGATVNSNTSGTITTLNANAGTTDFTGSRIARAVTTLNLKKTATVKYDTSVVAVSTVTPSGLISLSA